MSAVEMIKVQIECLEYDIKRDEEDLAKLVEQFKEKVQRLTATDIVFALDAAAEQKRITEQYNKIKSERETLQRLQYIVNNAKEEQA